MKLKEMPREALQQFYAEAKAEYDACKAKGLKLDMSRGKPEKQQLDLSNALFSSRTGFLRKRRNRCAQLWHDGWPARLPRAFCGTPRREA